MKKVLAMVFAVVMAISLFAIGASARTLNGVLFSGFDTEKIMKTFSEKMEFTDYESDSKTVVTLGENGLPVKLESYYMSDGQYELSTYRVIEYADKNNATETFYDADTNKKYGVSKLTLTDDLLLTKEEYYIVDADGATLILYYTDELTYDANGNEVKEVFNVYIDGTVIDNDGSYVTTNTYDENGNLTSCEEVWLNDEGDKWIYAYDAQGREVKMEYFEHLDSQWVKTRESETTYDENGKGVMYQYGWDSEQDIRYEDSTVKYEITLVKIGDKYYTTSEDRYNYDDGQWVLYSQATYEYDADGAILKQVICDIEDGEITGTMTSVFTYYDVKTDDTNKEDAKQEEVKKTNPETGDTTPVVVLASVMALSLAGVVITKKLAK